MGVIIYYLNLFQLLKGFINYVSTEDIRRDPWVRSQLNILIFDLRKMQQILLRAPLESPQKPLPKKGSKNSSTISPTEHKNNISTERVLSHIYASRMKFRNLTFKNTCIFDSRDHAIGYERTNPHSN